MTVEETTRILTMLKTMYPSQYKNMTRKEGQCVVNLWAELLSDKEYRAVFAAIKAYVATDTTGFAPSIGKINELMRRGGGDVMTEQEAISLIMKAARNGIYGAEEEFKKLPPLLQRLTGSSARLKEWAKMPADELQTVVASNLMRSFRVAKADMEFKAALPDNLKAALSELGDKLRLEDKDVKNSN